MGLTLSAAINMFLQQFVNQRKIPFEVVAPEIPNSVTAKSMQETLENKGLQGPYATVQEMMEALDA